MVIYFRQWPNRKSTRGKSHFSFLFFIPPLWPSRRFYTHDLPGRRRNKKSNSIHPLITLPRPCRKRRSLFCLACCYQHKMGGGKKSQCKPRPVCTVYIRIFCLWLFFLADGKSCGKEKIVTGRARAYMSKAELVELKCVCVLQ